MNFTEKLNMDHQKWFWIMICVKKNLKRSDFRKNRKFYNYSSENDWLDDFFPKK